jgi:hypothetical protein
LIDLRSRLYSPETGRFLTQDSWQGDYNRPATLNRWEFRLLLSSRFCSGVSDVNLRGAHLRGADLRGADLRGTYLIGAYLNGAYLEGAVYNKLTKWPAGLDPVKAGAKLVK